MTLTPMIRIPLFVSSTFRDFHVERDALRTRLLPRLNEVVARYGAVVTLVDLRWGVVTESAQDDEREREILGVCRSEISQARPLFLGLLGTRYGSPVSDGVLDWALGADAAPFMGRRTSVTAVEVWQALSDSSIAPVFAFRRLSGSYPGAWQDDDQSDVRRLREFVEQGAKNRSDVIVIDYDVEWEDARPRLGDVIALVDDLAAQLTPIVTARARELDEPTEDHYRRAVAAASRDRLHNRQGREPLIGEVLDHLQRVDSWGCTLIGPSGVGKSTVALVVADRLEQRGWSVARIHIGMMLGRASTSAVVGLLCDELGAEPPPPIDLERAVGKENDALLDHWVQVVEALPDRTLILVDGLDATAVGNDRTALPFLAV